MASASALRRTPMQLCVFWQVFEVAVSSDPHLVDTGEGRRDVICLRLVHLHVLIACALCAKAVNHGTSYNKVSWLLTKLTLHICRCADAGAHVTAGGGHRACRRLSHSAESRLQMHITSLSFFAGHG